jgi:hypothetical protein
VLASGWVGADSADHRGRDPRQIRLQFQHLTRRRQLDDGPAGPVVHPLVGQHLVVTEAEGLDDLVQVLGLDGPAATGGRGRERQQAGAPPYLDQTGIALLADAVRPRWRCAPFQPGVGRAERRVAGEGQLAARGEDPQPVVGRGRGGGRTNVVSERFVHRAMRCMSASSRSSASRITATGLPR